MISQTTVVKNLKVLFGYGNKGLLTHFCKSIGMSLPLKWLEKRFWKGKIMKENFTLMNFGGFVLRD